MRGRKGWWQDVRQSDGTFSTVTKEQAQAHIENTYTDKDSVNADIRPDHEQVAEEKRRRIQTGDFDVLRQQGTTAWVQRRYDVEQRNERLEKIAKTIQKKKWEDRTAAFIARKLAKELDVSENTVRLDVKAARERHGLASSNRK